MTTEQSEPDFFISYASADREWAKWIDVELRRGGYTTVMRSFRPGTDFVHQMQVASATARRTIAILSPSYFGSQLGEAEWRTAFAKDPAGEKGLLIPVRVKPCRPSGLLATRAYVDLVETAPTEARRRLFAAIGPDPALLTTAPFPRTGRLFRRPKRAFQTVLIILVTFACSGGSVESTWIPSAAGDVVFAKDGAGISIIFAPAIGGLAVCSKVGAKWEARWFGASFNRHWHKIDSFNAFRSSYSGFEVIARRGEGLYFGYRDNGLKWHPLRQNR